MKKTELAWAAGLIDGEGCICLLKHPAHQFKRAVNDRFTLILKVTMCCKKTVRRLHKMFGVGSCSSRFPKEGQRFSPYYTWWCNAVATKEVLDGIRPYLVTKAIEADVALAFLKLPLSPRGGRSGSRPVSKKLQKDRQRYFERLRALKTRSKFRSA